MASPSVNKSTGLFAAAFCGGIALLAYTYYLIQTNQQLDMQAHALAHKWYYLKPAFALRIVQEGGFMGTLTAVVLTMVQGLIMFGVIFGAAYYALSLFGKKEPVQQTQADPKATKLDGINSAEIPGSELMVMLPKYPGSKKGELLGGAIDKQPYTQNFYRISRAEVATKENVELSSYQKLYVALYSMLKAHPDVPASIGSHHADTPLFQHSVAVSKKVQEFFRENGKAEPLAAIAGLAHDMDKLLAYKGSGDKWTKNVNATHHHKYAAYIVTTQPEFRELPVEDRNTLVLAIRYYHDPDNLPIGTTARTELLVQALRLADGYTTRAERTTAVDAITDETYEAIDKAIIDTISSLNINNYMNQTGHAGGWTTPALEFVLTPMSTILDGLSKFVSSDLAKKLQLDHETRTYKHPAAKVVSERLNRMGLLMTSYKNMTSSMGLYDTRIGVTRFRAVVMIDKVELEKRASGLCAKWDTSNFRVRVMSATEDISTQGDSAE